MAILHVEYMSACLERIVPITVVLPCDVTNFRNLPPIPAQPPYKTLYLLHGVYGADSDWLANTNIQRMARERQMAVVMPGGENHFFTDTGILGQQYGEAVGKELVEVTRKMFRLSDKREDTSIAGLSMGAYGAFMNGLKYHDTFGHIGCLSMAVIDQDYFSAPSRLVPPLTDLRYSSYVFGDLSKIDENLKSQRAMAAWAVKQGFELPEIYIAIGTEDFLLEDNRGIHACLTELGIPHVYKEAEGTHNFDFWAREIADVLDWLPHGEKIAIQDSGNIMK